jgi:hypothetical protein
VWIRKRRPITESVPFRIDCIRLQKPNVIEPVFVCSRSRRRQRFGIDINTGYAFIPSDEPAGDQRDVPHIATEIQHMHAFRNAGIAKETNRNPGLRSEPPRSITTICPDKSERCPDLVDGSNNIAATKFLAQHLLPLNPLPLNPLACKYGKWRISGALKYF